MGLKDLLPSTSSSIFGAIYVSDNLFGGTLQEVRLERSNEKHESLIILNS